MFNVHVICLDVQMSLSMYIWRWSGRCGLSAYSYTRPPLHITPSPTATPRLARDLIESLGRFWGFTDFLEVSFLQLSSGCIQLSVLAAIHLRRRRRFWPFSDVAFLARRRQSTYSDVEGLQFRRDSSILNQSRNFFVCPGCSTRLKDTRFRFLFRV